MKTAQLSGSIKRWVTSINGKFIEVEKNNGSPNDRLNKLQLLHYIITAGRKEKVVNICRMK